MNSRTYMLALSGLAVALNVVGGSMVSGFKIPLLFLDTIGTIFIAVVYGPAAGFLVGVVTNLMLGVTSGPTHIPFGLVNGAVGLVVGLIARRYGFQPLTAVCTGVIVAVVAPLVGTPITILLYGALTDGSLDTFVLPLQEAGAGIFSATFLPRVGKNLIDKILCALLVGALIEGLPQPVLQRIGYQGVKRDAA